MKPSRAFLLCILFCSLPCFAQNVRWDLGAPGSAGAVTTGSGSVLVALGSVQMAWSNYPANAVPCTNFANTYPSLSSVTPCPTNTQIVLQGSSTCVATSDNFGNLGVYAPAGNYSYTLTANGVNYGPYTVTIIGNAITSVFGRIGAVTAQTGDYSVGQVTGAAPLASPPLTGNPTTATTPAALDNSTKIPNTAFFNQPNAIPPSGVNFGGVNGNCWINSSGTWIAGSCAGTAGTQVISADSSSTTVNGGSGAGLKSYTFGAGVLNSVNKTFHVQAGGQLFCGTLAITAAVIPALGGSGQGDGGLQTCAVADGAHPIQWSLDEVCTTKVTGASGQLVCDGFLRYVALPNGNNNIPVFTNGASALFTTHAIYGPGFTFDLTSTLVFSFTSGFSAGNGSNIATQDMLIVSLEN